MKRKLYVIFILIAFLSAFGCASTSESKVEESSTVKPAIFFQSIKSGDADDVERLLNEGAEVNASDSDGYTALMFAANTGDPRIIELLLKAGAQVNLKDNEGYTALMVSVLKGYSGVSKLLIDAGADVNAKEKSGATPLMMAANIGLPVLQDF